MIQRQPAPPHRAPARGRQARPWLAEVRKRGLVQVLAAFLGSGWFIYEIVHFVLVEHYSLPDRLKDITIVTVIGTLLCALAWRWFRGGKKKRKLKWEFVLVPLLAGITGALDIGYLTRWKGHAPRSEAKPPAAPAWRNSVAVLPFVNMSPDKDQEYFCDGLTEELITQLSQVRELKVTARTSAFAFKGGGFDIREIGRRLGVEKVLEGSVRKDSARIRVSAQLINVADGFHVWSETYDRELDEVFIIQDEIARAVAGTLKMTLLASRSPFAQTKSLEAYNEYLLGQHYYNVMSAENLGKAIGYYRKAVEIDPEYARAWVGLGAALAFQAGLGFARAEDGYARAVDAVETGLALDPSLAYGYTVKGWIQMTHDWDWSGADKSFAKALSLDPARGYFGSAQLALALGHLDRAVALARRAADLDALSMSAQLNLALATFYAGHPAEARELFLKAVEISPESGDVYALLAQVHLAEGHPDLALAVVEKEKDPFFRLPGQAMAYHGLGRHGESLDALARFIADHRDGGAYQIAQVYAFRGEKDEAFRWLEIAYRQHDGGLFLTKVDPLFRELRSDPRFAAFLRKMGFPPGPGDR